MRIPRSTPIVVFLLWAVAPTVRSQAPSLSPSPLTSAVQRLAENALGSKEIQAAYDSAVSQKFKSDAGKEAVTMLTNRLSAEFKKREDALNRLRLKAEEAYQRNIGATSSLYRCCNVDDNTVKFDSRFNTTISADRSCDRLPDTQHSLVTNIAPALQSTFRQNLIDVPQLKWQYFASEEGFSTFFPTLNLSTCGNYDPRYRPWYVAAAVPEPKNVVVILDHSGSMSDPVDGTRTNRLELAKEAVYAVLDTFYPTDDVTVVAFSTTATRPPGCFQHQLGQGTPNNIKQLKAFVKNLSPGGATNYIPPMETAFQLLKSTLRVQSARAGANTTRDNVILFLSDGAPKETEDKILSAVRMGNAEIGNRAVILTYAAGGDVGSGEEILRAMAEQGSTTSQLRGEFKLISDFTTIRQTLGRYYSFFSKPTGSPVVYSMPYYDGLGLGLVITIAAPIRYNLELKGIIAVDVRVDDVLSEVTYFVSSGDHQYAFVVDKLGHAVIHPMLPVPLEVHADPIFQNVKLLEPDAEFVQVYNSMIRRESGNLTYTATRYVRRGNSKFQGTQAIRVLSTYYWQPVKGTDYVVCVVLQTEEIDHLPTLSPQPYQPPATLYHRLDVVLPSVRTCSQFGYLALADHTTVKFSPEAFINPSRYLNLPETKEIVQAYVRYLDDTTGHVDNRYFKPSVRDNVRLTAKCEQLWNSNRAAGYKASLVWRYIATTDGVFRVIPGSQLARAWSAFQRGWYLRAMSNPGKITFSTPYIDGFGAGYVITLAQTIALNTMNATSVAGVIALDFTMGYLWQQLLTLYPHCASTSNRCFVMDKQGYLLVHQDFIEKANTDPTWVHLAHKESLAAYLLIQSKVLRRRTCANYELQELYYSYEVTFSGKEFTAGSNCLKIYELNNTNIYLGILSTSPSCAVRVNCQSCSAANSLGMCQSSQLFTGDCTCPCFTQLEYNSCSNNFTSASRSHDVCPPEVFSIPVPVRRPDATKKLEPCFDGKCSTIKSYLTCDATVGCNWCVQTASKEELSSPYCATDLTCFAGVQGQCNPKQDCSGSSSGPSSSSSTTIIALVIAAIVLVVLIGIAGRWYQRSQRPRSSTREAPRIGNRPATVSSSAGIMLSEQRRPSEPSAPPIDYSKPPPDYNSALAM